MARKKAVRNEDDLFIDDTGPVDREELELDRSMEERGYDPMSQGSYRSSMRALSDELPDQF